MTSKEKGDEPSTSRTKISQLGILFVAVIMISGSLGYLIRGVDGPSGFDTIIMPGSMVQPGDFVVFRDDGGSEELMARNGGTGEVQYSGANDVVVFRNVINATSDGGTIYMVGGLELVFDSDLVIEHPGIIFQGGGASAQWNFGDTPTTPTEITGNIIVENENTKLRNFNLEGDLTLEGPADLTDVPQYFACDDVAIWGTVAIMGRTSTTSAEVPFNVYFTRGTITPRDGTNPCIELNNSGNAYSGHIYFDGVLIDHKYDAGNMLEVRGLWTDVHFSNCLFYANIAGDTFMDFDLSTNNEFGYTASTFKGCSFEIGAANQIFMVTPSTLNNKPLILTFLGGAIAGSTQLTMINDDTSGGRTLHQISFISVTIYGQATLQFDSVWNPPQVPMIFDGCFLKSGVTVTNIGGSKSAATFRNCHNFNPVGVLALPFVTAGAPTCGLLGTLDVPGNTVNYTIRDIDVLISSYGGTVSSIELSDQNGVLILTGLTVLNRTYLPIGFHIKFTYSAAPTVIVEGL